MAGNVDYRVLLLTSIPDLIDSITAVTREHFSHVEGIYWEMGNMEAKREVMKQLDASDYNLIISHINGLILKRHHLARASFGAINIHAAPPEHPGAWGLWCQPVIRRDIRTHHGVTLHEIDEQIDHGPIYAVERWEVGENETIEGVLLKSEEKCREMLEFAAKKLAASPNGTKCFPKIDERWDTSNAHSSVTDIQAWFRDLDPNHPAHNERIFFNHPKGTYSPPYFTDIE